MGFFDALNSDEGRAGLAMMAAAGPQAQPMGFGQRMMLAQALQDQWDDRGQKRKMGDMQLREAESQIRARDIAAQVANAKMAQQQRVQDMIAARLGGARGPASAGAPSTQSGMPGDATGGAGMSGGQAGGGGNGSSFPFDINDVALLQASGGPDLLPSLKFAAEGIKREAGATYIDPVSGRREYMPKMAEGVAMQNGTAIEVPGYGRATGAIEAARTGANEAAKFPYAVGLERNKADIAASNDIVTVTLENGQTLKLPRSAMLDAMRQQGQQPQQGQGGGMPGVGGGQQLTPALRELIARDAAANNIDDPKTSFSGARQGQAYGWRPNPSVVDEGQGGGQGLPGLQVQSEAGAAAARKLAEGRAEVTLTQEKKGVQANDLLGNVGRAKRLLGANPTASGVGTAMDQAGNYLGVSSTGAENAAALRNIGEWMTSNVPRMEGPQSNFDAERYRSMAGMVGDSTVPVKQRMAALQEVERLQQKYAGGAEGAPARQEAPKAYPAPPRDAVNALKMRGRKASAQFDEIFGPGAADQVFGGK